MIQFTVDQEVAQDSARRPEPSISPSFDSRLLFIKDKNRSRANQVSLFFVQSASNSPKVALSAELENAQCICSGLYYAVEGFNVVHWGCGFCCGILEQKLLLWLVKSFRLALLQVVH